MATRTQIRKTWMTRVGLILAACAALAFLFIIGGHWAIGALLLLATLGFAFVLGILAGTR